MKHTERNVLILDFEFFLMPRLMYVVTAFLVVIVILNYTRSPARKLWLIGGCVTGTGLSYEGEPGTWFQSQLHDLTWVGKFSVVHA